MPHLEDLRHYRGLELNRLQRLYIFLEGMFSSLEEWWEKPMLPGISRRALVFCVIAAVVLTVEVLHPINWDWVFGRRIWRMPR